MIIGYSVELLAFGYSELFSLNCRLESSKCCFWKVLNVVSQAQTS